MKEKFSISGMTCTACSAGIEKTIKKLNGVTAVEVSLMGESMFVEYDDKLLSREKIIDSVISLGYGACLYEENLLKGKKSQSNNLKKRFLLSLCFLF